MGKLVGVCVVLFMLAFGFLFVTEAPVIAALFSALWAEPLLDKVAWAILVLVPLVLLPSAVWLCDTLVRQRKAANALELRLDGVRLGARELAKSQIDAEAAVHHLARNDPEAVLGAVSQRLTEAERVADIQEKRNEIPDLQSRVDEIRIRQQGLKQRLAPVLETRRSIERLFMELDTGQDDLERALAEIASGDDATALDLRLRNLMDFVAQSHERCDNIENASKSVTSLKQDYADLHARLAPFAAAADGVTRRVKDLSEARDRLAASIDSLQRTPDGPLAQRVQDFANESKKLDNGVSDLNAHFTKLAALHGNIGALTAKLESALLIIPAETNGHGASDVDTRVDEVSAFVTATQEQLEDIEDRLAVFGELKAKLGDLQSRLAPLESKDTGVVNLIRQVQELRDQLVAKIGSLQDGDGGDLAARVRTFTEAKQELEERVSTVSEHFSQLASVRKDLAGLFDKLSSAANGSNGSSN